MWCVECLCGLWYVYICGVVCLSEVWCVLVVCGVYIV